MDKNKQRARSARFRGPGAGDRVCPSNKGGSENHEGQKKGRGTPPAAVRPVFRPPPRGGPPTSPKDDKSGSGRAYGALFVFRGRTVGQKTNGT